jgi:hypothetical protein
MVVLEETEYRRLQQKADEWEPLLPDPLPNGNYPALEYVRASLVRDIIRHRRRLGLTQVDLARRAGIRPETLNRIEQGKHRPGAKEGGGGRSAVRRPAPRPAAPRDVPSDREAEYMTCGSHMSQQSPIRRSRVTGPEIANSRRRRIFRDAVFMRRIKSQYVAAASMRLIRGVRVGCDVSAKSGDDSG